MIIRCWGSRGSVPVSGKEYLKYGGDTTCLEVRGEDDEIIIIDAGSGIRSLGNKLLTDGHYRYNMIFTHAHWDHILGFPFFKPLYIPRVELKIIGCPFSDAYIKSALTKAMAAPYFPVKFSDTHAKITYENVGCSNPFNIGSIEITTIRLSHPNQGVGYKLREGDKTFVFLTDNELGYNHHGGMVYDDYLRFSTGADLLFHDAEYTDADYKLTITWGHSLFKQALSMAMDAGVRKFGLFHHNQDRSDSGIDKMVTECREILKYEGIDMECLAVAAGDKIKL